MWLVKLKRNYMNELTASVAVLLFAFHDIKAPNYHYQHVFRLLKAQYPNKKTAIFSSWEAPGGIVNA